MRVLVGTCLLVLALAAGCADDRTSESFSGEQSTRPLEATDPTSTSAADDLPEPTAPAVAGDAPQPIAPLAGPSRATVEEPQPVARPAVRRVARVAIELTPATGEPRGEDGRGNVVDARDAIAIEIVSPEPMPVRALDPVLRIGQLRFTRYTHPSPYRLRYVAADRAMLPEGEEATLQWGDDVGSRVVVTRSLVVP